MGDVIAGVRRVAEELLFGSAGATDGAERVPAGHLEALAEVGAFGIYQTLEPAERREVHRILGGACGATYFVWAQHEGPVRILAASANEALQQRWCEPLLSGQVLGGTVFAHLRRPGPPMVRAEPDGSGWRLHGEAPWATGWGMAGVYSIAAVTPTGAVLFVVLPPDRLVATPPLRLAVLQATATVRLHFDATPVGADDVAFELERSLWDAVDLSIGNRGNPAVQGLALRAIALLEETGPGSADLAGALRAAVARTTADNEALVDAADAGHLDVAGMAAARAYSIALAQRAALALVAAVGGGGLEQRHPAQRLVREAAFYAIQAQTAEGRAATLALAAQGLEPNPPQP